MYKAMNILLIDDNKMDVELVLDAFNEVKLRNKVNVAAGGEEGLDYLFGKNKFQDRSVYSLPDIILLDLKMPRIDGFEVLKQIKNAPKIKRIPVIILTSSLEETDRILSYDIGTNSYLVKPISFRGFLDVVKKINDYWLTINVNAPNE
jgi:CheY-like chemotaxis protein